MKISSGVDTQELLAVLREGGYLSVGGAPLKEILSRLEQAERIADTYQTLYEQRAETLEQAEQAVARVGEYCSNPNTSNCCTDCEAKNEAYLEVLAVLDGDGRG